MEALVCKKLGDPTVPLNSPEDSPFTFTTTYPIPELQSPTSVRVRIKATSLNFGNYLQIQGKYQEKAALPFILVSDYSGVIDSVGSKVTKFRVGDPACSETPLGCFAEFIIADETELFRVPDGCDLVAAGAIPIAYGTSHVALVQRAKLRLNHVLMVLGAAGGVGIAAVQIGKACGATVIAVARAEFFSVTTSSCFFNNNASFSAFSHLSPCVKLCPYPRRRKKFFKSQFTHIVSPYAFFAVMVRFLKNENEAAFAGKYLAHVPMGAMIQDIRSRSPLMGLESHLSNFWNKEIFIRATTSKLSQ